MGRFSRSRRSVLILCVVLAFGEVALHGVDNVAIAVGEAVELARAFVESYVFALRVGDGDNIERV